MPTSHYAAESLPNPESYTVEDFFDLLKRQFRLALDHQETIHRSLLESEDQEGSNYRHPANYLNLKKRKSASNYLVTVSGSNNVADKAAMMLRAPTVHTAEPKTVVEIEPFKVIEDLEVAVYFQLPEKGTYITDELINNCQNFVLRVVSDEADATYSLDHTGIHQVGESLDPEDAFEAAMQQLEQIESAEDLLSLSQMQAKEIHDWVSVIEVLEPAPFVRG